MKQSLPPITYKGEDEIVIDTSVMEPGTPYRFRFGDQWRIASLRPDGTLDIERV